MTTGTARRPVYVAGASAVSAFGFAWRGLGRAVAAGALRPAPSVQLRASHGEVLASEVPAIPPAIDADLRAQKLMSHPARLAAVALGLALADAGWPPAAWQHAAFYMGVGASGGSMAELTAMLNASISGHAFSLQRFSGAGLAACNPLFAFQLMNNFTLCHGAIQAGVGGPNSAFYSRGTGTLAALSEAHWALASGECDHALAGGADSALHPVTWASLCRDGHAAQGLWPGEGAALLALGSSAEGALARVDHVAFQGAPTGPCDPVAAVAGLLERAGAQPQDLFVIAPWGGDARRVLKEAVARHAGEAAVIDTSVALGEALAAAPALAWVVALDALQQGPQRRAVVLSAGIDGGWGLVVLEVLG